MSAFYELDAQKRYLLKKIGMPADVNSFALYTIIKDQIRYDYYSSPNYLIMELIRNRVYFDS